MSINVWPQAETSRPLVSPFHSCFIIVINPSRDVFIPDFNFDCEINTGLILIN